MQEFTRSAGRKNPLETALIWKSDFDQALKALAPKMPGWDPQEITSGEIILQIVMGHDISRMQRDIISICILKQPTTLKICNVLCKETQGMMVDGKYVPGKRTCCNIEIISRMRKSLNKQNRDESGKFKEGEIMHGEANVMMV